MNINILDGQVPDQLKTQVWEYIQDQTWYVKYKKDSSVVPFVPRIDGLDYPRTNPIAQYGTKMSRTLLASDEKHLQLKHPVIYSLWQTINTALGGGYTITGVPETAPQMKFAEWQPKSLVSGLEPGWRVYTNGQATEDIKHSQGIHRDNPNLNDDNAYTILYVANLEWYPSWFAECVYYGEDPDNQVGDHQHLQQDSDAQQRNFRIGWSQQIVSPVPGRIIAYDSRTLHTTRPAATWAKTTRVTIAFRARQN